jgi:vitamin B12 transporter
MSSARSTTFWSRTAVRQPPSNCISPPLAPAARTYEGGGEQAFWGERIVFRASYFHNEFGREIESVGAGLVPALLPNLTPPTAKHPRSIPTLTTTPTRLDLNSAFRAQGIESTVESGIGKNIFLRGGYTYLDSVVQRSFSSDNEALLGGYAPTFDGIPIGHLFLAAHHGGAPLPPPPHTGFFTASYASRRITASSPRPSPAAATTPRIWATRTFNEGNSLLLPNRNLDHGYAKLDLGGSYSLLSWLAIYAQAENLLNNQHIAPHRLSQPAHQLPRRPALPRPGSAPITQIT